MRGSIFRENVFRNIVLNRFCWVFDKKVFTENLFSLSLLHLILLPQRKRFIPSPLPLTQKESDCPFFLQIRGEPRSSCSWIFWGIRHDCLIWFLKNFTTNKARLVWIFISILWVIIMCGGERRDLYQKLFRELIGK